MNKFSKTQIEEAAKVLAGATGEWSFYEYPINEFKRKEYRKKAEEILEASGAFPGLAEAQLDRIAELVYDENTGTRGKFQTSTYRDKWIKLVRDAAMGVLND